MVLVKGCDFDITIARHEIRNTRGFKIPDKKTEKYKSSFFVRTAADWNKLEDTVVIADSVTAFHQQLAKCHTQAARSKNILASF